MVRVSRVKDPLTRHLLPGAGSLAAAQRELRFLKNELDTKRFSLVQACILRGKYMPLQYILGTQPFGDLDIICRPNVLIPRWETEEWTLNLAKLLAENKKTDNLSVMDVCTGTGCIPMLLSNYLTSTKFYGVDISEAALRCYRENIEKYEKLGVKRGNSQEAIKTDILGHELPFKPGSIDIITANPPYITKWSQVDKSVKLYEPALALKGDLEFYDAIIKHGIRLEAKAIVFELGSSRQFEFVRKTAKDCSWFCSDKILDSAQNLRTVTLWKDSQWSFLSDFPSFG